MKYILSIFTITIFIIGLFTFSINENNKFVNASSKAIPSVVTIWSFQNSQYRNKLSSIGSGVIFSSDGYLVTNYHVISGAKNIIVRVDNSELDAKVIGFDPNSDIAVLKIDHNKELEPVSIGSSESLRVGDEVLAIGNPYGIGISVSSGIISATGREYGNPYLNLIQTDAAINPGNSGGALINNEGNLIGINTKIFSKTGAYQGLGFAIPSEKVTQIAAEIIKFGEVRKPWIGNFRVTSSRVLLEDKAFPSLKVVEIEPNQGIYLEGLRTNDQIIKVNSLPASWNNLTSAINYALPGDSISIDFINKEGLQKITVQVSSYKKAS
jgi:S1-C subfamily serine protease